jgi:hypothetical protein
VRPSVGLLRALAVPSFTGIFTEVRVIGGTWSLRGVPAGGVIPRAEVPLALGDPSKTGIFTEVRVTGGANIETFGGVAAVGTADAGATMELRVGVAVDDRAPGTILIEVRGGVAGQCTVCEAFTSVASGIAAESDSVGSSSQL